MSEVYIVNPLSNKEPEAKKEEPEEGRDISLCCITYLFCCIPIIAGSTG
jgi:hypothetical protein